MPTVYDNRDPLSKARRLLGTRYKWGGGGKGQDCPPGVDCSGLTQTVYSDLPRTAREQYRATERVSKGEPGDLVFFRGTQKALKPSEASHVGIVSGPGRMIDASSSLGKVVERMIPGSLQLMGYGRPKSRSTTGAATRRPSGATTAVPSGVAAIPPGSVPTPAGGLKNPLAIVQPFLQGGSLEGLPASPYDRPAGGGMSPAEDAAAAVRAAAEAAISPYAGNEAQAGANMAALDALIQELGGIETPERRFQPYTAPAMPERRVIAPPERPAPQMDPMGAIGSVIAGFLDPQGAGHYAAAEGGASRQVANQQYGDLMSLWQIAQQQADQEFGDRVNSRAEQIRLELDNTRGAETTDYQNRLQKVQQQKDVARLKSEATGSRESLNRFGTLSRNWTNYNKKTIEAQEKQNEVSAMLTSRQGFIDNWQKDLDRRYQMVPSLLNYFEKGVDLSNDVKKMDADQAYKAGQLSLNRAELDERRRHNKASEDIDRRKADADAVAATPEGQQAKLSLGLVNSAAAGVRAARAARASAAQEAQKVWNEWDNEPKQRLLYNNNFWTFLGQYGPYVLASQMEQQAAGQLETLKRGGAMVYPPGQAPPTGNSGNGGKKLDANTALSILKEAKGDKNKARALARQRGYSF